MLEARPGAAETRRHNATCSYVSRCASSGSTWGVAAMPPVFSSICCACSL